MNKFLSSIVAIFLIYGTGSLIGNFFSINMIYILPFVGWFIALILFYLILDEKHKNIFMEKLNELQNE
tara:strand:- start:133 stop:336 length:204 start_codon:yes stop_codon:yes gene_type:complete